MNVFVCPNCKSELKETNLKLICNHCKREFPIINNIPRFVKSEHYVKSFGIEWTTYDVQRIDEDKTVFAVKTGLNTDDFKGKFVLDAGCGSGRYAYISGMYGATVFAVDMSQAVEKANELCKSLSNINIIQADLMNLPFKPEMFDIVYSIGVLHHTTDTRKAFDNIARYVKPGGIFVVWVYRKNTFIQEFVNNLLRSITTRIPLKVLHYLSYFGAFLGGIPIINKILPRLVNFSNHPDWKIRICDTFDWFSPKYQYHHTAEEVREWFIQAGFDNIKFLLPQKRGKLYDWTYHNNLIIGSGVNYQAKKKIPAA